MASGENAWRASILNQLNDRNRLEKRCFQDLIRHNSRLFESANALKEENVRLTIQNEKLRISCVETSSTAGGTMSKATTDLIQQKLAQQEELTSLHRCIGEKAQQIINLNEKLLEAEKALVVKEESLQAANEKINSLKHDTTRLHTSLKELKTLEQHIRDEYQALQITCAALEEKLRKVQDENRQLIERLISYKSEDADKMNKANEKFLDRTSKKSTFFRQALHRVSFGMRGEKMRRELADAARETSPSSTRDDERRRSFTPFDIGSSAPCYPHLISEVPTKMCMKFDGHDSEINAVKWSTTDRLVATGGADRRIKLWDISKGVYENRGNLIGSNQGVTTIDFDSTGTLLLGASNDFASRIWKISDQRLQRHERDY